MNIEEFKKKFDEVIKNNKKILLTHDGRGMKAKEDALHEIIKFHRIKSLLECSDGFAQSAFYGDDAERGNAGILIDKSVEHYFECSFDLDYWI